MHIQSLLCSFTALALTMLTTSCAGFSISPSPCLTRNIRHNSRTSTKTPQAQPFRSLQSSSQSSPQSSSSSLHATGSKATLDENTTWRLRFALNGVPTKSGRKVGELFVVDVQFIEEEGFEPPQGEIRQILPKEKKDNGDDDNSNVRYLKVTKGRWKLSEDPNDRKDGLWVWGLFAEPLYPFMLLQLETEEYALPGPENDAITPLTLYAQINHKRDKKTGEVELDAASLNLREVESINADPFGVAKVDIFEEVKVGQLSLRPLLDSPSSALL